MALIEFSEMEKSIVRNMMLRKSHKDIAKFLEREEKDITSLISELLDGTGIVTRQMQLDAKPKPVRQPTAAGIAKEEANRKRDYEKHQKKLRLAREQENFTKRRTRNGERICSTKLVDYSQMKAVRLDEKTLIFVKPDEDIDKIKKHYLKVLRDNKSVAPAAIEIKKFK